MSENKDLMLRSVEDEMSESYISYAMSVIVSRALPDVRDGMKPVIRRILFAMHEMKLFHNAKYKKSAAVVGEVLGKYHPHGDSSVYEALVRLAQPFSLRYPLVDGQGNFGSIDGDGAAAMRYTEARMTKIAEEMMKDIDQDTVNWMDNYDNSRKEPMTVPTKFPNHLCNGTMGIAVGMATNMAPHNLREVIDACLKYIGNSEITAEEIMEVIKGPDFPTGGIIFDPAKIKEVYIRGKGGITMRGKSHFEEAKGHPVIVIDELPYQVNKANLVAKVGELANTKKIEGIADITDESSKNLIRVTIKLRKGVNPDDILTMLYKFTDLQCNFNLNNVVLTEGGLQPRILNIRDLVTEFVDYRREVVLRRSKFQLKKAQDRLHILEGLQKAIDILDDVIATIRGSQTRQDAKLALMGNYEFTEEQAEYILMLRLQTLVGLEIEKILNEIGEKQALIEYLLGIINDPKKLDEVVIEELNYIRDTYGDDRRTDVSDDTSIYRITASMKQLQKMEEMRRENVILRISNTYETKVLYQTRVNIIPDETFVINYTNNQDKLIVITEDGELVVQRLKDMGSHAMKGPAFDFTKEFKLKSEIVYSNSIEGDYKYLVIVTNKNKIKKIEKTLIAKFKKFPTKIMSLDSDEKIIKVIGVNEDDHIGALSENGMILVFPSKSVRPMGKTAGGVKTMELDEDDNLANIFLYTDEMFIFIYTHDFGKMIAMEDMKIQKRGQKGLIATILVKDQKIMGGMAIEEGNIMLKHTTGDVLTLDVNKIRLKNRITKLDKLTNGKIAMVYRPWKEKAESLKFEKEEVKDFSLDDYNNKKENNNDKDGE